jgi:hypothetical protein
MAHARVVRLRRVGEQARRAGGQAIELAHDGLAVDPQRRRGQRQVGRFAARGPRELADAVDRVVVVGGEEQAAAVTERVGPDRRSAALALAVNTTSYSSGEACRTGGSRGAPRR